MSETQSNNILSQSDAKKNPNTYTDVLGYFERIQMNSSPANSAKIAIQEQELKSLQNPPETLESVGIMLNGYLQWVGANDGTFGPRVLFDDTKSA